MMGTKVRSLAQAAGVKCPKETGEMSEEKSCRECEHYFKCLKEIARVMF